MKNFGFREFGSGFRPVMQANSFILRWVCVDESPGSKVEIGNPHSY
jgi:hypothetical protein